MKNSAMENRDYSFIQITRDDKLIDFIIFTFHAGHDVTASHCDILLRKFVAFMLALAVVRK